MSKPDAIGLEGNEPQGREQDGKRQLARSAGRRAICVSVAPLIIDLAPGTAGVHSALPPYRTGGNLDVRDLSVGRLSRDLRGVARSDGSVPDGGDANDRSPVPKA